MELNVSFLSGFLDGKVSIETLRSPIDYATSIGLELLLFSGFDKEVWTNMH